MKKITKTRERLIEQDQKESPVLYYRHLAAYKFSLSYIQGKRVLEVGSSDGYGSYYMAKAAKKVTACDIDKKTIAYAKQKYKLKNLNFMVIDALKLQLKDKFDVIISFQVIEHIKDVNRYLTQIQKCLKKDGVVIFSTPNREIRLAKNDKPWNPYHVYEYTAYELQNLLSNYFSKTSVLGLHASPTIYRLETRRLSIRRLIAKFDFFSLYERIPRKFAD